MITAGRLVGPEGGGEVVISLTITGGAGGDTGLGTSLKYHSWKKLITKQSILTILKFLRL